MPTLSPSGAQRTGAIQEWTVSEDAVYLIECYGSQGGPSTTSSRDGGQGAYRYGEMTLMAGEVIKVIVAHAGTNGSTVYEGGGGGGSFVYKNIGNELLCAAGGGGGSSRDADGKRGEITEAGTSGTGSGGAGGTGGNGGESGHGAAGGGWHTTGGTANWSPSGAVRPGSACKPGAIYDTSSGGQAYGGLGNSTSSPDGGFGGGAGAHGNNSVAGGGAGGYSGGGGGGSSYQAGGGGGSFVHASMSNIGGTPGTRTGDGLVVITLIAPLTDPPNAPQDLAVVRRGPGPEFSVVGSDPDGDQVKAVFEVWIP